MNTKRTEGPAAMSYEYFARKTLTDGRIIEVIPLTYGRARLGVGLGWLGYDDVF